MSRLPQIDPDYFVATVQPALQKKDPNALYALLKSKWTAPQVISLLRCDHEDARNVAALCVSLVGTSCCIPDLLNLLKDPCPCVNQIAEHALWSIWFRAGTPEANHQLARGAQAMQRRDFRHAIRHFDRAIALSPDFAEAFNQRAVAHLEIERFHDSLHDCAQALQRMPQHFGAWASRGYSHAHLGDWPAAMDAYTKALQINPHMQTVQQAVSQLHDKLAVKE